MSGIDGTSPDGLKLFCGGHSQVTSPSLLSPPGPGAAESESAPESGWGAGLAPGPSRVTAGSNRPPTVGSPRGRCYPGHPTNASPHHRGDPTRTTPGVKRSHKLRLPHADRRRRDHALGTPTGVVSAWGSALPRRPLGVSSRAAQGSTATAVTTTQPV